MSHQPMITIAGGGTGGHVMPALALADMLRSKREEVSVKFIGAERGLEAKLLPARGEELLLLKMHAIQGAGWLQRLRVLGWELPSSVFTILKAWRKQRPTVLIGVGGYASVAGVVAAIIARVPVVLYEQNAIPGMVNRTLYRFCNRMMLGFASAEQFLDNTKKAVVTGNIIRSDIAVLDYEVPEHTNLLIVGGSQGAMFLNETVPLACEKIRKQGLKFSVTHLVGAGQERVASVKQIYHRAGIEAEVLEYSDEMPALLAKATLLVARSGAMTVCEAAAVGLPALFVPLPSAADNHQYFNAEALEEVGAAKIIDQKTCTVSHLSLKLKKILFDREKLKKMSEQSKAAFIGEADKRQYEVIVPFLGEGKS